MMYRTLAALLILTVRQISFASNVTSGDSLKLRKAVVWTANTAIPVGTHAVLYQLWYSDYEKTKFHFVNDNHHWDQMDKFGHFFSANIIAVSSAASFRWAGYSQHKSALLGSSVSLGFQYAIEYFDGHSSGWGASPGDLVANTAGTLFGGMQSYFWGKVKIPVCITFQNVRYAPIRPELLGKGYIQQKLKDYNSQTYWLNFYPKNLGLGGNHWPQWLGFSLGYGIDGFLGAETNLWTSGNTTYDYRWIPHSRQFYFSPAVKLGQIKTRSKVLKTILRITDYWKLPLPCFSYNSWDKSYKFHWIFW